MILTRRAFIRRSLAVGAFASADVALFPTGTTFADQKGGVHLAVNSMSSPLKYRMAHFSDFHLSDTEMEFNRAIKLIQDAISQKVNHIVITGDVVDKAQTKVLKQFWSRLRRLVWTEGTKITFCPGNHDIFPVTKKFPFITLSKPTTCYHEVCKVTGSSRQGAGVQVLCDPYPVGKLLSEFVVMAVLDTTRNGQNNPKRWAEGEIPDCDQENVSSFFKQHHDKPHRIIAMHHTPVALESESSHFNMNFVLPKTEVVQKWLQNCGATLVLCGHVHCETTNEELFKGCRLLQSGTAGGCDEEGFPDKATRSYHIIDLENTGNVEFTKRSFLGDDLIKRKKIVRLETIAIS